MAKKSCQNNVTVENQDFDLSVDNVLPDMLCITLSNGNCCYKGALLKCNKENICYGIGATKKDVTDSFSVNNKSRDLFTLHPENQPSHLSALYNRYSYALDANAVDPKLLTDSAQKSITRPLVSKSLNRMKLRARQTVCSQCKKGIHDQKLLAGVNKVNLRPAEKPVLRSNANRKLLSENEQPVNTVTGSRQFKDDTRSVSKAESSLPVNNVRPLTSGSSTQVKEHNTESDLDARLVKLYAKSKKPLSSSALKSSPAIKISFASSKGNSTTITIPPRPSTPLLSDSELSQDNSETSYIDRAPALTNNKDAIDHNKSLKRFKSKRRSTDILSTKRNKRSKKKSKNKVTWSIVPERSTVLKTSTTDCSKPDANNAVATPLVTSRNSPASVTGSSDTPVSEGKPLKVTSPVKYKFVPRTNAQGTPGAKQPVFPSSISHDAINCKVVVEKLNESQLSARGYVSPTRKPPVLQKHVTDNADVKEDGVNERKCDNLLTTVSDSRDVAAYNANRPDAVPVMQPSAVPANQPDVVAAVKQPNLVPANQSTVVPANQSAVDPANKSTVVPADQSAVVPANQSDAAPISTVAANAPVTCDYQQYFEDISDSEDENPLPPPVVTPLPPPVVNETDKANTHQSTANDGNAASSTLLVPNAPQTPQTRHIIKCELSDGRVFRVGDVIWGKITGFPWWPGRITLLLEGAEDSRGAVSLQQRQQQKAHVKWFGSSTMSVMSCSELYPFLAYYKEKFTKKRKGCYRQAIKEANALAHAEVSPPGAVFRARTVTAVSGAELAHYESLSSDESKDTAAHAPGSDVMASGDNIHRHSLLPTVLASSSCDQTRTSPTLHSGDNNSRQITSALGGTSTFVDYTPTPPSRPLPTAMNAFDLKTLDTAMPPLIDRDSASYGSAGGAAGVLSGSRPSSSASIASASVDVRSESSPHSNACTVDKNVAFRNLPIDTRDTLPDRNPIDSRVGLFPGEHPRVNARMGVSDALPDSNITGRDSLTRRLSDEHMSVGAYSHSHNALLNSGYTTSTDQIKPASGGHLHVGARDFNTETMLDNVSSGGGSEIGRFSRDHLHLETGVVGANLLQNRGPSASGSSLKNLLNEHARSGSQIHDNRTLFTSDYDVNSGSKRLSGERMRLDALSSGGTLPDSGLSDTHSLIRRLSSENAPFDQRLTDASSGDGNSHARRLPSDRQHQYYARDHNTLPDGSHGTSQIKRLLSSKSQSDISFAATSRQHASSSRGLVQSNPNAVDYESAYNMAEAETNANKAMSKLDMAALFGYAPSSASASRSADVGHMRPSNTGALLTRNSGATARRKPAALSSVQANIMPDVASQPLPARLASVPTDVMSAFASRQAPAALPSAPADDLSAVISRQTLATPTDVMPGLSSQPYFDTDFSTLNLFQFEPSQGGSNPVSSGSVPDNQAFATGSDIVDELFGGPYAMPGDDGAFKDSHGMFEAISDIEDSGLL